MKNSFRNFNMTHRIRYSACGQDFRDATISILACLIVLCGPIFAAPMPVESPEKKYLDEKKSGNFGSALDILWKWTLSVDDPSLAEVNLFRIRELMIYPELYDRGIEALNSIGNHAPAARFLRDRISIMTAWLLLKKGQVIPAERAIASLSYMGFRVIGPCTGNGPEESGTSRCPENAVDPAQTCPGECSGITWSLISPDRMGLIDIDGLNGNTAGTLYYFLREIRIEKDGDYYLVLGKTGYIDLRIDGNTVFSDRTMHGFDHDQYFIPVHLAAGSHGILIKAGSSPDGIKVSLRLADAGGGSRAMKSESCPPLFSSLVHRHDPVPIDYFRAGYILLESRSPAPENDAAIALLSRIPESDPLYSAACFYLGRACTDRDKAAGYFRKSIAADPENNESLRELAEIAINRNLFYDAFPHIKMMKKIGPAPAIYEEAMARLFLKMGWTAEVRRHAAALKRSSFPSAGLLAEAGIFSAEGDLYHESLVLERLMELDRYDRDLLLSRASVHEKSGDLASAALLLHQATALFPNDTGIKLRLASAVHNEKGAGSALPYLAAALNTAPGNPALLKALGLAYLNLGKIAPAEYYLRMALCRDPADSMIRLNLDIINGNRAGGIRH